jgi:hypothetical protein
VVADRFGAFWHQGGGGENGLVSWRRIFGPSAHPLPTHPVAQAPPEAAGVADCNETSAGHCSFVSHTDTVLDVIGGRNVAAW